MEPGVRLVGHGHGLQGLSALVALGIRISLLSTLQRPEEKNTSLFISIHLVTDGGARGRIARRRARGRAHLLGQVVRNDLAPVGLRLQVHLDCDLGGRGDLGLCLGVVLLLEEGLEPRHVDLHLRPVDDRQVDVSGI